MGPAKGAAPQPRLQVSVIEARNIMSDVATSPDFYVKLKMGAQEFQTDIVRGSLSPKFLKDVRMEVSNPETDNMRMEMLQVSPKGDLVLGSEKVAVKPLMQTGTLVQWFNLLDAAGLRAAELCLVLRYSSGDKTPKKSNRSKSPQVRSKSPQPAAAKPSEPKVQQEAPGSKKPPKKAKRKSTMVLPLPIAIVAGGLAGFIAFLWSKRPIYYEVKEGDTLCKIGICFNRPHSDIYNVNSHIISDPNVIYPGDRLRII